MPSLFLDRDGVINRRIPGDYVKTPDTFELLPGVEEALRILAPHFQPIVVCTNQAGIGKGLMTELELSVVHQHFLGKIQASGARIDRIYHCPHRADAGCACRKPLTGMAWQALAEFPEIDFEDAWMVGDSKSDMAFARALGIKPVLIRGKLEELAEIAELKIEFQFDSLLDFAKWLTC